MILFFQVIKCDLLDPLDLAKHMEGCIAVLSALGQPGLQISAMTFYEDSMKSIVTAMRNAKIKRLICMTSFYTKCKFAFFLKYLFYMLKYII